MGNSIKIYNSEEICVRNVNPKIMPNIAVIFHSFHVYSQMQLKYNNSYDNLPCHSMCIIS